MQYVDNTIVFLPFGSKPLLFLGMSSLISMSVFYNHFQVEFIDSIKYFIFFIKNTDQMYILMN